MPSHLRPDAGRIRPGYLTSSQESGSIDIDDVRIVESVDEAIDISLRALKLIYRKAPELIDRESAARTKDVILRGMRENAATRKSSIG
jgi:hypothetical protein